MAKTPDQTAFETIIAESQATIAGADPSPVKRGRGRPKKVESETERKVEPSPVPVAQPAPDISEHIKGPLMALSKIPAHRHGIPALALDQDEALACATALNEILKAFVPDQGTMSPKTAAVVMGVLTFGSIGFTKYQIYSEEMAKRNPEPEAVPEVQEVNADLPTQSATGYFRRPGLNA
jgi:hypothetical protein